MWSRTTATGSVIAETADANRGTTVATTKTPGAARAWNTPGSIGSTPVQRDRKVGQQDDRVVVAPVDRDPGDSATRALGPLAQQGGLAVAGRGDHTDERRGMRDEQPVDQRGPGHDPRAGPRRMKLGLHQLKGWPRPRPSVALKHRHNTLLLPVSTR
jgi:hypothetical protein